MVQVFCHSLWKYVRTIELKPDKWLGFNLFPTIVNDTVTHPGGLQEQYHYFRCTKWCGVMFCVIFYEALLWYNCCNSTRILSFNYWVVWKFSCKSIPCTKHKSLKRFPPTFSQSFRRWQDIVLSGAFKIINITHVIFLLRFLLLIKFTKISFNKSLKREIFMT